MTAAVVMSEVIKQDEAILPKLDPIDPAFESKPIEESEFEKQEKRFEGQTPMQFLMTN
jgi:hypothetical protein